MPVDPKLSPRGQHVLDPLAELLLHLATKREQKTALAAKRLHPLGLLDNRDDLADMKPAKAAAPP